MYCNQCGHDVEGNVEVCPYCGEKMKNYTPNVDPNAGFSANANANPAYDAPKFCVHCGAKLETGASFCTNCGSKIEAPSPQPVYTPYYTYSSAPNQQETPGKILGILSIVLGFFINPIVGIVLGIIAIVKGNNGNYAPARTMGIIGIIISVIKMIFDIMIIAFIVQAIINDPSFPDVVTSMFVF